MNEAKQKADELVALFYEGDKSRHNEAARKLEEAKAIKRALITVNEVLKVEPTYYGVEKSHKFWQAVKEELESRL